MQVPNCMIECMRHVMLTVDDLNLDLNGAQVFSKLNLEGGYHEFGVRRGIVSNHNIFYTC